MTREYQLLFGKGGDCLRASIASILEVPTASLPHYSSNDGVDQVEAWNQFLAPANLKLEDVNGAPYDYYIAGVRQGGVYHACVGKGRAVCHDPLPGTKPPYDGYEIAFHIKIAKIDPQKEMDLAAIGVSPSAGPAQ